MKPIFKTVFVLVLILGNHCYGMDNSELLEKYNSVIEGFMAPKMIVSERNPFVTFTHYERSKQYTITLDEAASIVSRAFPVAADFNRKARDLYTKLLENPNAVLTESERYIVQQFKLFTFGKQLDIESDLSKMNETFKTKGLIESPFFEVMKKLNQEVKDIENLKIKYEKAKKNRSAYAIAFLHKERNKFMPFICPAPVEIIRLQDMMPLTTSIQKIRDLAYKKAENPLIIK